MSPTLRTTLAAACCSLAIAMASPHALATAQQPADPSPTAPASDDGANDTDRAKNELARARADMERRLKVLEEAQGMLERGETPDAVRDFLKSKNMGITARLFDERRRGPAAGPAGPRGTGLRDRGDRPSRRMFGDRDGPPGDRPGDRPGDGPGEGPGPGGHPPPLITVEEREIIRDVLRQLMPQRLDELDRLAKDDQPEAEHQFMKLMDSPRIRSLLELRRSNPEAFALRVEEFKAAAECHRRARAVIELQEKNAPAEQLDAERAALRTAAERLFDKRIEGLSKEVERLADKAASLRTELDDQNARRSELIAKAVDDAIERAKKGPPKPPREGERDRPRDAERGRPGPR